MIKFYTPLGKVSLTNDYFAGLVGNAVTSCYGVAGMHCAGAADSVKTLIFGSDIPEKGVVVSEHNGELVIDLHIKVLFGLTLLLSYRASQTRCAMLWKRQQILKCIKSTFL